MGTMRYPVAEKFKSLQGEGLYTGTPMAFIRFVGCSVGKGVCTFCDTDFDRVREDDGGGLFEIAELSEWIGDHQRVCLTGGEPLDRDLGPFLRHMAITGRDIHIETSGTVSPSWLFDTDVRPWVTVSPKPGHKWRMLNRADEIKVIYRGLGNEPDSEGWPTLEDAILWSREKIVYLQPRNMDHVVDMDELNEIIELVILHPTLRVSTQLHKFMRIR